MSRTPFEVLDRADVLNPDRLSEEVRVWLGSLEHWPDEPIEPMLRRMAVSEDAGYGVQALLLSFVSSNDSEWPPITPQEFLAYSEERPIGSILVKHATVILQSPHHAKE